MEFMNGYIPIWDNYLYLAECYSDAYHNFPAVHIGIAGTNSSPHFVKVVERENGGFDVTVMPPERAMDILVSIVPDERQGAIRRLEMLKFVYSGQILNAINTALNGLKALL